MSYGLYLADIETFDVLIDWLEEHINESITSLNAGSSPKDLRKTLKEITENKLEVYEWTMMKKYLI
jgi:hypothetical protein